MKKKNKQSEQQYVRRHGGAGERRGGCDEHRVNALREGGDEGRSEEMEEKKGKKVILISVH